MNKGLYSDLPPNYDPKGGARTPPGGIARRVYEEEQQPAEPSVLTHHGFFHLDLKDWLQFLVLLIMAILFIFQRQSDVNSLSNNVANLQKTVEVLVGTVDLLKRMTETNSSDIRMQAERNNEQDRRITANEAQLATVVPDVREIRTKLNLVAEMLDEQRKAKK